MLSHGRVGIGKPSVPCGLSKGVHAGAGTWLSQASSVACRWLLGTGRAGSIPSISPATSEPECLLQMCKHFKGRVPLIRCAWSAMISQAVRCPGAFPSSAPYFCPCSPFFSQEGGQGIWLSPGHCH